LIIVTFLIGGSEAIGYEYAKARESGRVVIYSVNRSLNLVYEKK